MLNSPTSKRTKGEEFNCPIEIIGIRQQLLKQFP